MVKVFKWMALISLFVLIIPPMIYLGGGMELDTVKLIMIIATVAWFVTASLSMWNHKQAEPEPQKEQS